MKKILKYITLLIVTVMCASCEEAIDGDTLIVISEREYGDRRMPRVYIPLHMNR